MGDLGSIPGLGRSPGEGKGYPLQYSGLENSTDSTADGVAKSWTRLSDFHFIFSCAESPLLSGLFSGCGEQGNSLVVMCGLFMVVAPLVADHRL